MNAYQIAQPQTGAAVSVDLQKMHPGNRLKLMLGLPLLPEPDPEQQYPDKAKIPFLR